MNDYPAGSELLAIAKQELAALLGDLPKEHQLTVRMVLKAMSIVERELRQPSPKTWSEQEAQAIRQGTRASDETLHDELRQWVEDKLAVTNPKYLAKAKQAASSQEE